jgi:4-hydroxy-2-oxoheptanedioate aldolase
MRNLKLELSNGFKAVGSMIWCFGDSFVPLLYKNAGYDCLFIDMEHSTFTYETTRALVQTCRLCSLFPFVRVAKADKESLMKAWDLGAGGIVVPMVESAEQAKEFIRYSKYPPLGKRGMGPGLGNMDYSYDLSLDDYIKATHERQILLIQPETQQGVKNIDEILAVEGIDGILTGPYDLSASLGVPGKFDDPAFREAGEKVITAAREKGKLVAAFAANRAQAQELAKLKVNILVSGLDSELLYQAAEKLLGEMKEIL